MIGYSGATCFVRFMILNWYLIPFCRFLTRKLKRSQWNGVGQSGFTYTSNEFSFASCATWKRFPPSKRPSKRIVSR